jgi:hypothetical protein
MIRTMKTIMRPAGMALLLLPVLFGSVNGAVKNDRSLRTREFVVMGYEGIRSELRKGEGPYLRTLMELLEVPATERDRVQENVRAFAEQSPNIMDFADRVAALAFVPADAPGQAAVVLPSGPNIVSGAGLENALAHLTRGTPVTVYLKSGERLKGVVVEYSAGRLWLRGADRRSARSADILALESGS